MLWLFGTGQQLSFQYVQFTLGILYIKYMNQNKDKVIHSHMVTFITSYSSKHCLDNYM
jgi:hypothetical protein